MNLLLNLNKNLIGSLITTIKIYNPFEYAIITLNRNAREPKKANHGARPCSSVMRRLKKKSYYRRWKENTPA